MVKIGNKDVKIFKIKNRRGYAAMCCSHLTEGETVQQAYDRMVKTANIPNFILCHPPNFAIEKKVF